MSNTNVLTLIGALLAGYFLLGLPLGGTFLAAFGPAIKIIAILTVLVFAAVLIYKGILNLLGKH
ncbi:hypothetical protein M3196_16015 [Fictibacillus nanhaiensis]|jgi:hypothetical protein|uniref:hypothetical protein n=1 Tax=Fictibacillus TaxID=1329200 RepID=UPI001CF96E46|nr:MULTISPECIES: hypothetical protein [Fictibacillus]MCM3733160.1 hypothetical protein [Fictibacillus nanhaiensis]